MAEAAATLRAPVIAAIEILAARRNPHVARILVSHVELGEDAGLLLAKTAKQKNGQFGEAQKPYVASIPPWALHCPVTVVGEWAWRREWLDNHKGRRCRMRSARAPTRTGLLPAAPFFSISRPCLVPGLAAAALSAALEKILGGEPASPREGGARLELTDGVPKGPTRLLAR